MGWYLRSVDRVAGGRACGRRVRGGIARWEARGWEIRRWGGRRGRVVSSGLGRGVVSRGWNCAA